MTAPLRIATRGSRLALWQARHVAELLRPVLRDRAVELVEVRTTGDQIKDASLTVIGGQGAFTKEIQQALLDGRADLAVHSLKDLPTAPVPGLTLAAVPPRAATGDAFISRRFLSLASLPHGARVATGSSRRRAALLHRRPDLRLLDIRGNVETRLRKLDEEELDGIVLARAGLERLGLAGQITQDLDQSWCLPAVGQGALGLECRADDRETRDLAGQLNDASSWFAALAERAFLRGLGGGCLLPIGALGEVRPDGLHLRGVVYRPDGTERLEGQRSGRAEDAEAIGQALADELLGRGAGKLLS
jgi:hydroxymethylbilane synthase